MSDFHYFLRSYNFVTGLVRPLHW